MKIKKSIIITILVVFALQCFSQDENINIEKYWSYRERLKYFVVPGLNTGQSNVASERRSHRKDEELGFGDQTQHLGWYMGVLATEYKLLVIYKGDVKRTLRELYYAFEAYKRLDMCESKAPWNKPQDKLDGFFNRHDVPTDFCTSYLNELNQGVDSNYIAGNPAYISGDIFYVHSPRRPLQAGLDEMSQDNAIYLLLGFALVKRLLPSLDLKVYDEHDNVIHSGFNFQAKSIEYASLIINYIAKENWIIYRPDGEKVERGHNAQWFSYGFNKSYKYFNGYETSYSDNGFWRFKISNGGKSDGRCMQAVLATIGNVFSQAKLIRKTNNHLWHPFYIMLHSVLHSSGDSFNIIKEPDLYYNDAIYQINQAPESGPFQIGEINESREYNPYTVNGKKGWCSPLKYAKSKKLQNNGTKHPIQWGTYNGLDYMLLYNLFHLTHNKNLPSYLLQEK
jgi:hypothetical protein